MGSAVSAVSGAVGSVLGGVGSIAGSAIGSTAQAMTPGIQTADQQKLNAQIAQQQANAKANTASAQQLQGQANTQLGKTNTALGTAQNQLTSAQGVNQGGNVQSALDLLKSQANGTAPSAAEAQLQRGTDKAIATQSAMANSGNLSQMIGGQKTAMDNAANLTQQSANEATQVRAEQQALGQQNYAQAAAAQAAQAGTNAAIGSNLAATNANVYGTQLGGATGYASLGNQATSDAGNMATSGLALQQGVYTQNAQNQVQAAGGLMNGAGAAIGAFSDENLKDNIKSDRASRSKGISDFFKSENNPKEDEPEVRNSPRKFESSDDDDPQMKARKAIKNGFMSSDENGKTDIKGDSMIHAFLDKLEPVTFDYKTQDGVMGRTPGKHMGILAQDVEKAPGGESMVIETPEGKAIDLASAVGMLMSAAADAHERVGSLEELFKSKVGKKK